MLSKRLFNFIVSIACFILLLITIIFIYTIQREKYELTKNDNHELDFQIVRIVAPMEEIDKQIPIESSLSIDIVDSQSDEENIIETDAVNTDVVNIDEIVPSLKAEAPLISVNTSLIEKELFIDNYDINYTISEKKYNPTEQEITDIASIIQLEVLGSNSNLYSFEDYSLKYWEMLAVAQCIRNRVENNQFPNSIHDVIYESHKRNGKIIYQFSPAPSIKYCTPTEEAIIAAKEVFVEGVTVTPTNYYFFCATKIEKRFERSNKYCLVLKEDNTYDKIQGHQTTFYGGKN